MFHYVNNLQTRAGDALVGYYVKLKDSEGNYATLYSDTNLTPISTVSGVADAAESDDQGMYDLYVDDGTYDVEVFDSSALSSLVVTVPSVPMFANNTSIAQGPRDAVVYNTASSFAISRANAVMGGFRFRGHYLRTDRVPTFPIPFASRVAEINTDLGAEDSPRADNWYAAFACADDSDTEAVIKLMPFLRIAEPVGDVAGLIPAGENVHDLVTTTTYDWTSSTVLDGVDCLVISESRGWSGRVAEIVEHAAGEVTLDDAGDLAAGDWLLPAPPGYDNYVYLGSGYFEDDGGGGVGLRNIYDSGSIVMAKMIYITADASGGTGFLTGLETTPVEVDARGYICPLATAVTLDSSCVLATAGGETGDFAEYFAGDTSDHIVHSFYYYKADAATSRSVMNPGVTVPFLYHQTFAYENAGATLGPLRTSGQFNITGWIEP